MYVAFFCFHCSLIEVVSTGIVNFIGNWNKQTNFELLFANSLLSVLSTALISTKDSYTVKNLVLLFRIISLDFWFMTVCLIMNWISKTTTFIMFTFIILPLYYRNDKLTATVCKSSLFRYLLFRCHYWSNWRPWVNQSQCCRQLGRMTMLKMVGFL